MSNVRYSKGAKVIVLCTDIVIEASPGGVGVGLSLLYIGGIKLDGYTDLQDESIEIVPRKGSKWQAK